MFKYNIINKPLFNIKKLTVDNILKTIYKTVNKEQKGTLNIVFLDDDSIQKLNKEYRKIDKTTDVLSFAYFEDFSELKKQDIAGEIIISEKKVISQGKEFGLGTQNEFYKLLIHSILHILGYDHENDNDYLIMEDLENKIYNNVFD